VDGSIVVALAAAMLDFWYSVSKGDSKLVGESGNAATR